MVKTMQEVYTSIDWIMRDFATGFFLITISENQQRELRLKYKDARVYMYRRFQTFSNYRFNKGYDRLNREAQDLFSFMELILFLCELSTSVHLL